MEPKVGEPFGQTEIIAYQGVAGRNADVISLHSPAEFHIEAHQIVSP